MIRPRHAILGVAAVGLGGAIALAVPGTADTPDLDQPVDELAMADESREPAPPPPPAATVDGFISDFAVNEQGVLTVLGRTQVNGAPAHAPIAVWIDDAPAEGIAPQPEPDPPSGAGPDAAVDPGDQPTSTSTTAANPVPTTIASAADPGEFKTAVQLREGPQEVCAIAENDAGPDKVLGCEAVMYRAQLVDGKLIVADYGSGATPRLGIAGEGTPMEAAERIAARAREWEEITGIPTIPAFDYIQTVAQASPGSDGDYSAHTSREDLDEYLEAIRSVNGLLILDFQPGGGRFMKQVSQYEEYLREPDVGLALDTEWRMPWGVAPATIIGYADAAEINEVGEYLAGIVAEENLPQKAFVIHQFRMKMVRNREAIPDRPELATIFHIDGHGTQVLKRGVYKRLLPAEHHHAGFKLFFDEDTNMMTPAEVQDGLARMPAMVSYQ